MCLASMQGPKKQPKNEHPTETAKTSSTQSTETAKNSIELHSGPGIEHSEHQNGLEWTQKGPGASSGSQRPAILKSRVSTARTTLGPG